MFLWFIAILNSYLQGFFQLSLCDLKLNISYSRNVILKQTQKLRFKKFNNFREFEGCVSYGDVGTSVMLARLLMLYYKVYIWAGFQ